VGRSVESRSNVTFESSGIYISSNRFLPNDEDDVDVDDAVVVDIDVDLRESGRFGGRVGQMGSMAEAATTMISPSNGRHSDLVVLETLFFVGRLLDLKADLDLKAEKPEKAEKESPSSVKGSVVVVASSALLSSKADDSISCRPCNCVASAFHTIPSSRLGIWI
jgi:hypothetical protein